MPSELGRLVKLVRLSLDSNSLNIVIPTELSMRGSPTDLLNIELTGSIPSHFARLTDLGEVWLGGSRFGGFVPCELCGQIDTVEECADDDSCTLSSSLANETALVLRPSFGTYGKRPYASQHHDVD
jgi:hypothetical protein